MEAPRPPKAIPEMIEHALRQDMPLQARSDFGKMDELPIGSMEGESERTQCFPAACRPFDKATRMECGHKAAFQQREGATAG